MTAVVADASSLVELLSVTSAGQRVHDRLAQPGHRLHIPHHCVAEVANAVRGLVFGHKMAPARGAACMQDLSTLRARRHRAEPLLPRMWELRNTMNAYDALYVALAESLDAILITADNKLDTADVRRLIAVEVIR